ncbi:MAG: metallophosphoesterase [Christensenellales bacterium]
MDRGKMLRRALRFTGRIPTRFKALYPVWYSAQLSEVRQTRSFPRLPTAFSGFTLAYASDIHFGTLLGVDRLRDLARRLQEMAADVILLGGDYGDDTASAIACIKRMPQLSARDGVFAAIGNHDHMGSGQAKEELVRALVARGIRPLDNAAHTLQRAGATLCICSTDDIKRGEPDFAPFLQEAARADFVLYAPHSPDAFPVALEQPGFRFDLAIAGHTHGGQLVILGHSLHSSSRYRDRYRSGWFQEGGSVMMVSNGVGCSLLPLRIGAPAQIHHVTLITGGEG